MLHSCSDRSNLPEWIHGNWITSLDNETIHENWKVQRKCISGENYMHYENKFQKEFLRIFEKNNTLHYQIVIEKDTLVFTCKDYRDADTLTFVNNRNPFPKRINYVRPVANKMSVWIENVKNDPNGIFFTFKKMK
ncbi:DUF6265 family protein [Fluviicola sp.]|uniref:DUF6265 family protein n=1 Tax=Fluviicola sp. TaxID=1917219 RepID=UPI0031E3A6F8